MARKSSWLNYLNSHISDGKFQVFERGDNAQVVGADDGIFVLEYDETAELVVVKFLDDYSQDVGSPTSKSDPVAAASLPATITDNGVNTDLTFSIYVDGVR